MNAAAGSRPVTNLSKFAKFIPPISGVFIALIVLVVGNFAVYFMTGYDVFMSLVRGGALPPPAGQVEIEATFISEEFGGAALLFIFVLLGVLAAVASSYIDALMRRRHSDSA